MDKTKIKSTVQPERFFALALLSFPFVFFLGGLLLWVIVLATADHFAGFSDGLTSLLVFLRLDPFCLLCGLLVWVVFFSWAGFVPIGALLLRFGIPPLVLHLTDNPGFLGPAGGFGLAAFMLLLQRLFFLLRTPVTWKELPMLWFKDTTYIRYFDSTVEADSSTPEENQFKAAQAIDR